MVIIHWLSNTEHVRGQGEGQGLSTGGRGALVPPCWGTCPSPSLESITQVGAGCNAQPMPRSSRHWLVVALPQGMWLPDLFISEAGLTSSMGVIRPSQRWPH